MKVGGLTRVLPFCLLLMACAAQDGGFPSRDGGDAPVPVLQTRDLATCLAEIAVPDSHPAHPALRLACADQSADATEATGEVRKAAEQALVAAAYRVGTGRLSPIALASNVSIAIAPMPAGTLALPRTDRASGDPAIIPGRGVPLVLIHPDTAPLLPNAPPEGLFEPVTITADVRQSGDAVQIVLRPVVRSELRRGDWADAAGEAYLRLIEKARLRASARSGFREPGEPVLHDKGIYLIEPYDPDRIPLLMIHGLRSSPETWQALTMKVLTDPDLHSRFQVWHAFYPTGLPPFQSAAQLRQQLRDVIDAVDPGKTGIAHRHIAVIGHSMGGIIARALVTDDAGLLWRTAFRVSQEDVRLTPPQRQLFVSILTLKHEPQIGFVGFINTPHRGSRTAAGVIGKIGSALINLPISFIGSFTTDAEFTSQVTQQMRPFLVKGAPDSVQSLSPEHPLLRALASLPVAEGVRMASVIGVRGGEPCLKRPGCVASDGVVSYESAHLDFGKELVVDGGHDGHSDPQAIVFLRQELLDWSAGLAPGADWLQR